MEILKKKNEKNVLLEEHRKQKDGSDLLLLKFSLLEQTGIVNHCFTTRCGGTSKGMFSTMNLSFARGDDPSAVEENFARLADALGAGKEDFVFTDQTHTTNVRKVTGQDAGKGLIRERDYTDVDGLITNEPGLILSAFFADCVPLYFVDPVRRAIGLSHSGWRGTVNRMGAATLAAMRREYGTSPADVICAIGPSICQDCYEVGEDVAAEFLSAFAGREREILREQKTFTGETEGKGNDGIKKYQLNLWRANEIILEEAGVPKEHIAVTNICTCCNPDIFFSHRASHGRRGNLGAFLALK